jgi:voltage-dependent potassium channel beta subunit
MKYRRVGKSGLKISEISLGSWLTYGGTVDNQTARDCLTTAVEHGINFIDSAEIYAGGRAEEVIAEWLADETVKRKNLVISSKVFWPTSDDVNDWGLGRKNLIQAIDGTLERLNLDYIDLYFMHVYDHTTPVRETVEALDDIIRSGRALYWGTSRWTAAQLERVNAVVKELRAHRPIVEQPMYNMLFRYIELEVMKVAKTHGMGLTVFSPLYQGILTGKYNDGIPEGSRARSDDGFLRYLTDEVQTKLKALDEVASSYDITMPQLALSWVLRRSEVSAAIVGATRPEQVIENVKASDVRLTPDTVEQIEGILGNTPEFPRSYRPNIYYEDRMG